MSKIPDVKLYVGAGPTKLNGEPVILNGSRCFSAAYRPSKINAKILDPQKVQILLDSGAYTDRTKNKRLNPQKALARQLFWEKTISKIWQINNYHVEAIVSYDFLIDEFIIKNVMSPIKWSIETARAALETTIANAKYLTALRKELAPRQLVLVCQGINFQQYLECIERILDFAKPGDILGFGGWSKLGASRTYFKQSFLDLIDAASPRIARAGISKIHIFGTMCLQSLALALYLLDRYEIQLSVDSTKPLLEQTWRNFKTTGIKGRTWQESVNWWQINLAYLRTSKFYRNPNLNKQLCLFS